MPTYGTMYNEATFEIAVIDANALCRIGLTALLQEAVPNANFRSFNSLVELTDDTPDMYVHYFVSAQIFIENSAFFIQRMKKVIVLTNGIALPAQWGNIHTLNVCQTEAKLVSDLMRLFSLAHKNNPKSDKQSKNLMPINQILSAREIEVVALVVKGLINKEIADKLNISLTTVISHRKNIANKLAIKTVSGLTVFAIANGIVEASEI